MRVVVKEEFEKHKDSLAYSLEQGGLFIYPTDTIYGLGCNALDSEAVQKIRDIKDCHNRPLSIIAPSKDWIMENCHVPSHAKQWLDMLPGPYTLVLRLKNRIVADNVNPKDDSIGVRIPRHWISAFVRDLNIPIVTTSANKIGYPIMTTINDIDPDISRAISYFVNEGEILGSPSNIIFLNQEPEIEKNI